MNIILLEKVRNLGNLGDTVIVKAGFGRNYLLPEGKAVRATRENLEVFQSRRAELEQKAAEMLVEAEARAEKLNALAVQLSALTSEEGKLYGSIGPHDIVSAIKAAGVNVLKREITMPEGSIHSLGEYTVAVQVHNDVVAQVKVVIVADK